MECFEEGTVSVWYGDFCSDDDLSAYLAISYSEEDDDAWGGGFLSDFNISDFDEDFSERVFWESDTERGDVEGVSYVASFIAPLQEDLKRIDNGANSLFFVYDCNAANVAFSADARMRLLSVYHYKKRYGLLS